MMSLGEVILEKSYDRDDVVAATDHHFENQEFFIAIAGSLLIVFQKNKKPLMKPTMTAKRIFMEE